MGARSRQIAVSEFSYEQVIEANLAVYRMLLPGLETAGALRSGDPRRLMPMTALCGAVVGVEVCVSPETSVACAG